MAEHSDILLCFYIFVCQLLCERTCWTRTASDFWDFEAPASLSASVHHQSSMSAVEWGNELVRHLWNLLISHFPVHGTWAHAGRGLVTDIPLRRVTTRPFHRYSPHLVAFPQPLLSLRALWLISKLTCLSPAAASQLKWPLHRMGPLFPHCVPPTSLWLWGGKNARNYSSTAVLHSASAQRRGARWRIPHSRSVSVIFHFKPAWPLSKGAVGAAAGGVGDVTSKSEWRLDFWFPRGSTPFCPLDSTRNDRMIINQSEVYLYR